MASTFDYEAELDEIRIRLYEKTKDLTIEERTKQGNERLQRMAAQYGFTIGTPRKRHADSRPAD